MCQVRAWWCVCNIMGSDFGVASCLLIVIGLLLIHFCHESEEPGERDDTRLARDLHMKLKCQPKMIGLLTLDECAPARCVSRCVLRASLYVVVSYIVL